MRILFCGFIMFSLVLVNSRAEVGNQEEDKIELRSVRGDDLPWSRSADASRFFQDARVVNLCKAIDKQDVRRVEELLDDGVSVNSQGLHKVTPLVWCLPVTDSGVFELLLRRGADPNVAFMGDFPGSPLLKGGTATVLVAKYCPAKALRLVLAHNGNASGERVTQSPRGLVPFGECCLLAAISSHRDPTLKIRQLLAKGAEPRPKGQLFPLLSAAIWAKQFESALVLLAAGADAGVYSRDNLLACHHLAEQSRHKHSESDVERIHLLTDLLKAKDAWRTDALKEITEFRRLTKAGQWDVAREYTRSLRASDGKDGA